MFAWIKNMERKFHRFHKKITAQFRDTESQFWRLYEKTTAIFGWTLLISFVLSIWNNLAGMFSLPTILNEYNGWFYGTFIGSLIWILKADRIKYRITKDPRDELFRKWWSFKYAQKYRPEEVVMIPDNYSGDRSGLKMTKCPKCGVTHGFLPDEEKMRVCKYYECGEIVSTPYSQPPE